MYEQANKVSIHAITTLISRHREMCFLADAKRRKLYQRRPCLETLLAFSLLLFLGNYLKMFHFMLLCQNSPLTRPALGPCGRILHPLFSPGVWAERVHSPGDRGEHQRGKYEEWLAQTVFVSVLNEGRSKGY